MDNRNHEILTLQMFSLGNPPGLHMFPDPELKTHAVSLGLSAITFPEL